MNGVGTLMFIFITKGKAPAYLGSSFAFLAPAGIVIAKFGYEYALGGFVAVGFVAVSSRSSFIRSDISGSTSFSHPLPWVRS